MLKTIFYLGKESFDKSVSKKLGYNKVTIQPGSYNVCSQNGQQNVIIDVITE